MQNIQPVQLELITSNSTCTVWKAGDIFMAEDNVTGEIEIIQERETEQLASIGK